MLVLTRKTQETIQIGNDITISILKLKGNAVRIGIEAPRDVRVLRGELPTFDDATVKSAVTETVIAETVIEANEAEQSDEETTVSEAEWDLLMKLAERRKPCQPVQNCVPKQKSAAPLAGLVRSRCDATVAEAIHSVVTID